MVEKQMLIDGRRGSVRLTIYVDGQYLAITKERASARYSITHKPTGMVVRYCESFEGAKADLERIYALNIDWDFGSEWGATVKGEWTPEFENSPKRIAARDALVKANLAPRRVLNYPKRKRKVA